MSGSAYQQRELKLRRNATTPALGPKAFAEAAETFRETGADEAEPSALPPGMNDKQYGRYFE